MEKKPYHNRGSSFGENEKFQQMIARNTIKIRRANNGFVINSDAGMQIAANLEEVKKYLDVKFAGTIDIKS